MFYLSFVCELSNARRMRGQNRQLQGDMTPITLTCELHTVKSTYTRTRGMTAA